MEENKAVEGRQTVQKRTINETKNKTMKRMKKNAKQLDNSMSLLKLPKDHHFLHKEFPSFFWERCICRKGTCSLTVRKAVARVEWAVVWLEHREDRADSPSYDNNLLIDSAFNNLSNRQLEKWKQSQEEILQIHVMHSEKQDNSIEDETTDSNQECDPFGEGNAGG